jgi:hypothetical protein
MHTRKATKYVGMKRRSCRLRPNTTYKEYKESAHMSLIDHPISHHSLDISPIWTPVNRAEVKNRHLCQV